MSTPSIPGIDAIKRAIRERHLQQLSKLDLVVDPLESLPAASRYELLVQWTNDSSKQINAGKANRVYGGKNPSPIDFNNAFMAFMESAAVYLRDPGMVVQAAELYRSGNNTEDALDLLENSTNQIDALAALWGMEFIQICDLVNRHPDGHSWLVGPFCGAFIPKDFVGNSPYIGIAFKGTNLTSQEVINDLMAIYTIRPQNRLWKTEVAAGFFYPVFSTYDQTASKVPFVLIQKAVQDIAIKATTTAVVHVTGHSLGGAYSTLSYAQLCIEGFGTPNASLGDLYTFGSPRAGRGDFAVEVKDNTYPPADNGSSWRIVNYKDYIPKLPASPAWPLSLDPFIHVDAAYMIYPDQVPIAQDSEIGTNPTWSFPTLPSYHYTTAYYASLTYATTNGPPTNAVTTLARYPLAVSTTSARGLKIQGGCKTVSADITLETDQNGCVVGTLTFRHFVAQITALGTLPKMNSSPTFSYNSTFSWTSLYSKENNCAFATTSDNSGLTIYFIVNGVCPAWATVYVADSSKKIDAIPTRGSCIWLFTGDTDTDDIGYKIINDAASIFDEPSS